MPSNIIQSLLQQKRIANIETVSNELKLEIYVLALREIRDRVAARKPRDIPQVSLVDYEDALQEISCSFYILRHERIGKDFKLEKQVIPQVDIAFTHISYAIQTLENEGKNHDYFQYIITFRNAIFQICAHFSDENE
jgi:hypothetical protein